MNYKLKFLFLGLLFVLCVNSVCATDSLNNMTLNGDVVLDEANYVVGDTILIDDEVSISSNEFSNISSINGNTIFNISSSGKLTLSNLRLSDAKGIFGGAIHNDGVLILNNCIFVNNKASYGGAIYNNGTVVLNNCSFISNVVSVSGGAIYNLQDNLIIQNSEFVNNKGTIKNGELKGGAIFNSGFNLEIINSRFIGNGLYNTYWYENGVQYGGAVYDCGGNLTVRNSIFGKNFIYGYTKDQGLQLNWKYGAAIYTISSETKLLNNIFDSNEIYCMMSSYLKQKIPQGGVATVYTLKVVAINNTFLNNSGYNPALYIVGNNSYVANNYFQNNTVSKHSLGIAIYVRGHGTVFYSNTFINNTGGNKMLDGANIFITKGGNEIIEYNYFEGGNGISYEGFMGGFPENYDSPNFNVTIKNNLFNNSYMGIHLYNASMANIESNQFINNSIGIHTYVGKYLNITNNYFKGGNSVNFGTAIDLNTDKTLIRGNVFDGMKSNICDSPGSCGGIIFIKAHYDDEVLIDGNFFINNEVSDKSGLISSSLPTVTVSNNYFGNNTIHNGSVFNLDNSKFEIFKNIFENNLGLLFKSDSVFYYFNDILFAENLISDYTGNIHDYAQLKNNASKLTDYLNEKYFGDSSPILDVINKFIDNIKDVFNKNYHPNNANSVDNSSSDRKNSTSDVDNSSSDKKNSTSDVDVVDNSTEVYDDSNVGDIVDKKFNEVVSHVDAGLKSSAPKANSPSKAYEIEKNDVSKNITNNNYLIWIVLVIIFIFALLVIGYKRK